jgi:hypothetical protein
LIHEEQERLRQTAESARAASEAVRVAAEAARAACEEARVVADTARQAVVDAVRETAATLEDALEQMKAVEEMRRSFRDLRSVDKLGSN